MKKQIIRIGVFGIILLIILLILSRIFIPKGNTEEMGMEEERAHGILGEKNDTVDIIIEGDSVSFTSIIPKTLWNEYGYTAYATGWPGKIMPEIYNELSTNIKNQSPDIVLLETNSLYVETKISAIGIKELYKILPIFKYHNRWKNLKSRDFFGEIKYEHKETNKGYYPSTVTISNEIGNYMQPTDEIVEISKINKGLLKQINKMCKEKNAELILISVPSPFNYTYAKHNGIQKLAEEENLEYIDLNLEEYNLNIDWHTDTRDNADHLNDYGAEKVTNYIKKYLNENKKLIDHRNDPNFSDWISE